MATNSIKFFLWLLLLAGGVLAQKQLQKCVDGQTVCSSRTSCVTWERGCSVGANCLQSGVYEKYTECMKLSDSLPAEPGKPLCKEDEIFARSIDKRCSKPPCPIRLGYNCYPMKGSVPTCTGIKCSFGNYCVIGEACDDFMCKPSPICKPVHY